METWIRMNAVVTGLTEPLHLQTLRIVHMMSLSLAHLPTGGTSIRTDQPTRFQGVLNSGVCPILVAMANLPFALPTNSFCLCRARHLSPDHRWRSFHAKARCAAEQNSRCL